MRIPIMKESHHGSGATEPTENRCLKTDPVEAKRTVFREVSKTVGKE